jgi:hypothetical protein
MNLKYCVCLLSLIVHLIWCSLLTIKQLFAEILFLFSYWNHFQQQLLTFSFISPCNFITYYICVAQNLFLALVQERSCCDFLVGNQLGHFSACAYILMIFSVRVIKSARADKPRALHALAGDGKRHLWRRGAKWPKLKQQ